VVLSLLVLLLVSFLAAPLSAAAQPAATPRVGFLGNASPPGGKTREAFVQGLRARGWIEGQNVTVEYRWAEGDPDRLPSLVAELIRARVDVIVLSGTPAIQAARAATSTLPVVFVSLADPIRLGIVASLARPGGNATGMASQYEELVGKQLELLKEVVPRISRVALIHHAQTSAAVVSEAEAAARRLGLKARALGVPGVPGFESAFETARSERAEAIHFLPSPFFNANRRRLTDLVARHRLPAVYEFKEFVEDGGLMSYGPSITEMHRGMASYVDRILRGARPGDLPVERATKFELALNLRTARALGLTIPQSVLARADDVLQ
jgi:putative ABC transport system substrate-binding protein